MAMSHSFVHHLLCSRRPGTRIDSQIELKMKKSPVFLNWKTEQEATGIEGERQKEKGEKKFEAHIWIDLCHTIVEHEKGPGDRLREFD